MTLKCTLAARRVHGEPDAHAAAAPVVHRAVPAAPRPELDQRQDAHEVEAVEAEQPLLGPGV